MIESLPQLEDFRREDIVNSKGVSFKDYRKTLEPRYWRVWVDIAIGYVMLSIGIACAIFLESCEQNYRWLAIIALPMLFGYYHHYIQLFFHEASHFNIAKSRKLNDFLANTFIGSLIGRNIKNYRPIHLIHHRQLGTPEDSEYSYFEALTFRFILESLTGIRAVKILLSYKKRMAQISGEKPKSSNFSLPGYPILVGAGINGLILCLALIFQSWILALTWFSGLFMIYPFVGSIRQLMEHRDEKAPSNKDFTKFAHGKVNRMFGSGPVASTLGGAGFNRHLLHHWEPQISYTNLAEVERFLNDTNVAPVLARHQTSYFRTFFQLLS